MSVSNFTSATFSVVKKYTQLAFIFVSKISHHKIKVQSNLRVKGLHVKAHVKIYTRVFCVDFSWKSAILHAIYARVSAAMPVACTVRIKIAKLK